MESMLDCFAEELSRHSVSSGDQGGDIVRAAARLGRTPAWGRRMYVELCKRLGSQAR